MKNIVEEFKNSCIIARGGFGVSYRSDRYVSTKMHAGVRMIPIFKKYIDQYNYGKHFDNEYFDKVKNMPTNVRRYVNHGFLANYDGYIVAFFPDTPGLDNCGLRLTYTNEEFNRMVEFTAKTNGKDKPFMTVFLAMCLDYLFDAQRVNLIKGLNTENIIYTFSNDERFIYMGDSMVRILHMDIPRQVDTVAYNAVMSAMIDRDVPQEEIEVILPEDIEAKLFIRPYDGYELAQIESLTRHAYAEA